MGKIVDKSPSLMSKKDLKKELAGRGVSAENIPSFINLKKSDLLQILRCYENDDFNKLDAKHKLIFIELVAAGDDGISTLMGLTEEELTEAIAGDIVMFPDKVPEPIPEPEPEPEPEPDEGPKPDNVEITPSSPAWAQYVLAKFEDEEMDGENPRLEGLRRVTELMVGEIIEEDCELVSSPTMENDMRACAKATVTVKCHDTGQVKKFSSLADACRENCQQEFDRFPTAMADTRAKGRCFRTALKLRRVIAAEESGGDISLNESSYGSKNIQTGQVTAITIQSDRLKVSIPKLLAMLKLPSDPCALTRDQALVVIKNLNSMTTGVPKGLERGD